MSPAAERSEELAYRTLLYYDQQVGERGDCNFRGLLTGLMHYADKYGLDFEYELSVATDDYGAEKE